MTEHTIKYLSQVMIDVMGNKGKIVGTEINPLIAHGENFGSIMLKVDIKVRDEETLKENLVHAVAKLVPPHETVQEIFNTQVTYKNEIAFYKIIVPTLVDFQREQGVTGQLDCFANYYGSRINLNGSDVVDNDAVLLLENLKVSGYMNINRREGFDLESTEYIFKNCASFHATALALKLKNPITFERNIKSYCHDYLVGEHISIGMYKMTKIILEQNEKCAPLAHKLKYWCENDHERQVREPFATLAHCDMWVNNIMQKFEDGKVVGNKFVDFQIFTYRSPAADLFFFLWTSVNHDLLTHKLDYFLQFYHKHFIRSLLELKCDTSPFSFENLLEEMRIESEFEFAHAIVFKLFIVNGKRNSEFDGCLDVEKQEVYLSLVSQEVKQQAWDMILECEKRGWFH